MIRRSAPMVVGKVLGKIDERHERFALRQGWQHPIRKPEDAQAGRGEDSAENVAAGMFGDHVALFRFANEGRLRVTPCEPSPA